MATVQESRHKLVAIAGPITDQLESLSLVLAAVGIDHWLDHDTVQILVKEEDVEIALFHLHSYQTENLHWPPPPPAPPDIHPQTPPTVLMMGAFLLFYLHTGPWSAQSLWFSQGAIDSAAILEQHEWWRLVTALTLHKDFAHLIGNCLIGGIIIHLLGNMLGYGLSWFLLIVAGAAGNFFNVLLHQQQHFSVGFSTSVFAAIGTFTGLQFPLAKSQRIKEMVLSLGAGVGLLAFLGSEGVQTDLGAHVFGFISGFGSGLFLNRTQAIRHCWSSACQTLFLSSSLAIVGLCWIWALQ